jgi:outer membrane biosynthesis protein TonB
LKLLVITASVAALWAAPAAAYQDVQAPTPDPAPTPSQPAPDPVPQPGPAASAPTEQAPAQEAPAAPPQAPPPSSSPSPPAEPAPAPAPEPSAPPASSEPVVQATSVRSADRPERPTRKARGGARKQAQRASRPGRVKPLPAPSGMGAFVEGLRARAADAAPPIAIAALALLALALTSGGFLVAAARRAGAWRA